MRPRLAFFPLLCVAAAAPLLTGWGLADASTTQPAPLRLDSLVTANSRTLRLRNGRLEGPGAEFLLAEAARSQFLVLGEEHNVVEIPELTTALLSALQRSAGYHYLALEQDPATMKAASRPPMRGHPDSVAAFARRYPHAFTFMSDQELAMIAAAGAESRGGGDPVWGLDQSFGATHALDRLLAITGGHSTPAARALASRYRDAAERVERTRDLENHHYLAGPKEENFARLDSAYSPARGSEAAFLIDNLVRSDRIYQSYRDGRGYDNGYEREELMKHLFMDEYARAQRADHGLPKVIVKMGHWHLYRGEGPSNLQTLGNFVSEFARVNGSASFHVAIHSHNPAGGFRSLSAWPDSLSDPLIARSLPVDQWTLVDLRPLRARFRQLAATLRGDQRDQFRRLVFGFDAALYMGGMRPGTYELNPGVQY